MKRDEQSGLGRSLKNVSEGDQFVTPKRDEPIRGNVVRPKMVRILVIEDDEFLRDMLMRSLSLAGYDVTVAANGREGLREFRIEPSDLVITDIVMPDHDGISTIIRLRDEFPDTPVLAISGTSTHSPHYLDLALKLGASRSLAKPFAAEALLAVVRELVAAVRLNQASTN